MSKELIDYLLHKDNRKETWYELAVKFKIKEEDTKRKRAKAANDIWRNFLRKLKRNKLSLTTVKKKYKEGKLIWETKQKVNTEIPDTEGMDIVKVTKGPYGSWTTYKNTEQYGLNEDQIKELKDTFSLTPFVSNKVKGDKIGVVDISDVHTGALVKVFSETVRQKPFDLDILISYLDQVANIVNEKKYEEVHLFIPGDIIESFTGFNHKDTYKNIQFHQGQVVIVAYQVIRRLLKNLNNCTNIYLVEGNHDRFTEKKDGNSRKGVMEVLSYFISENSNVKVNYHPFLIRAEIDNVYHLCTHGDWKPFKNSGYDGFFFKYGKQDMYNVLKTGHFHRFNIKAQTPDYLHYECPSIFTGGLFEEFLGFHSIPAFTILENFNDICSIEYKPLKLITDATNPKHTTKTI